MFKKIKNFDQLKEEVFEMKKFFQKTKEDVESIKRKFFSINEQMKDINKIEGGDSSFDLIQEDYRFKILMKEKMEEIDKKFKIVLGDFDLDENENPEKNNNENENSKNKKLKKNKIINLNEMSRRLNHYQQSKVNTSDFETTNIENKNNIEEIKKKLNDILKNLYGTNVDDKDKNSEYISNKNFLFVKRNEFEKYKIKTDEEIKKLWEKIQDLNKQYEEIFNKIKDNCTLNDLDEMKNVVLEKTKELLLNLKNKDMDNSPLQTLQKNFRKLLKLLAEKEEKENWLMATKPIGGHSCASCDNYIGNLKDETDRHIHWKKLPIKIKDKENNDKIFKIGNGYSRLLKMINFDNNGNPSLNPFENMNDYINNTVSNINGNNKSKDNNDLNKSGCNQSIHNITSKYFSKEKKESFSFKSRNRLDKTEKRLPSILISNSSDYFDKSKKKINHSLNGFNFMSPKLNRNYRKNFYKYNL